jgi:acetolactate synthase-1/2/3 large subunit
VAAAYVAHSPVVVLVGGVPLEHYQKDAFQDYDLLTMFRPVTKLAVQITRPERIPELLRSALRAAMSGRPGPVWVEIPRDVLNEQVLQTAILAPDHYRVASAAPHPTRFARRRGCCGRRAAAPAGGGGATRPG